MQFNATGDMPMSGVVGMSTRWVDLGHAEPLPRELWIELRGHADNIDQAVGQYSAVARLLAVLAAFVANTRVGTVDVHLAYDSTEDHHERQFLETFLPDELGGVTDGRPIRVHLLNAVSHGYFTMNPEHHGRLNLVLHHYQLALRNWYFGAEWLALAHLYMAVEALTYPTLAKLKADRGLSDEDFAKAVGVGVPDKSRLKRELEVWCRREVIFQGDNQTYSQARKASDGLEHGFLEMTEIAKRAIAVADKTFRYVRHAIVKLIDIPQELAVELMTIHPLDVGSKRKVIRGVLTSAIGNPAPDGEAYPFIEWASEIKNVTRDGNTYSVQNVERFAICTRPGVGFRLERIEVIGRLTEGQAPIELDDQQIEILPGHPTIAHDLLAATMDFINATQASLEVQYEIIEGLVLHHFSQGVAFFQSAQTLLLGDHPAEAALLLRSLLTVAGHFEQMATPDGMGLVVRIAVDGIARQADAVRQVGDSQTLESLSSFREHILTTATAAGIAIPDDVVSPEASDIWQEFAAELWISNEVAVAGYGHAMMHLVSLAPDRMRFSTKTEEGHLSDLIASACVIAMLDLVRHAATILGWTVNEDQLDQLDTEAHLLNSTAASNDRP